MDHSNVSTDSIIVLTSCILIQNRHQLEGTQRLHTSASGLLGGVRETIHSCPRASSVKAVFQWCVFFTYVYVRIYAQYASMNEFTYTYPYVYVHKKTHHWKTALSEIASSPSLYVPLSWPLYSINNGTDMSIVFFCEFSLWLNICII